MSVRIVINGKEVEHPLARFLFGLLAVVVLTLLGIVLVLVILPLIGVTLVVSLGIYVAIVLAALTSILIALLVYQYHDKKQQRLLKKRD